MKRNISNNFLSSRWTADEDKILKSNMYTSMNKLLRLLPGRTESAIYQRRVKLRNGVASKPIPSQSRTTQTYKRRKKEVDTSKAVTFRMERDAVTIMKGNEWMKILRSSSDKRLNVTVDDGKIILW